MYNMSIKQKRKAFYRLIDQPVSVRSTRKHFKKYILGKFHWNNIRFKQCYPILNLLHYPESFLKSKGLSIWMASFSNSDSPSTSTVVNIFMSNMIH